MPMLRQPLGSLGRASVVVMIAQHGDYAVPCPEPGKIRGHLAHDVAIPGA